MHPLPHLVAQLHAIGLLLHLALQLREHILDRVLEFPRRLARRPHLPPPPNGPQTAPLVV
jgi:hypothetical protein